LSRFSFSGEELVVGGERLAAQPRRREIDQMVNSLICNAGAG
jgi:hypothetical protein